MRLLAAAIAAVAQQTAGAPASLLSSATAWWVAKQNSGGNLVDQGSNGLTLVGSGTPAFGNDGTYYICSLRSADTDYFSIADNVLLDPEAGTFSVVIVTTPKVNLGSVKPFVCKRTGSQDGWEMFHNTTTPSATIDYGSLVTATVGTFVLDTRHTFALVINGASSVAVLDGTASSTVSPGGAVANAIAMYINRNGGATYANQDFYGLAIFKGTALSAAQTTTVATELLAADLL